MINTSTQLTGIKSRFFNRSRGFLNWFLPVFVVFITIRALMLVWFLYVVWQRQTPLASVLNQFDTKWYFGIAKFGYSGLPTGFVDAYGRYEPYNGFAFFPGFPYTIGLFNHINHWGYVANSFFLNQIFSLIAACGIYRLTILGSKLRKRVDAERLQLCGLIAVILFASIPMNGVFFLGYTEAVFIGLSCWVLVCVWNKSWVWAGVLCLLAGLVRINTIVLLFILSLGILIEAYKLWELSKVRYKIFTPKIVGKWFVGLVLGFAGLCTYLIYVGLVSGLGLNAWFTIEKMGWNSSVDLGTSLGIFTTYVLTLNDQTTNLINLAIIIGYVVLTGLMIRKWYCQKYGRGLAATDDSYVLWPVMINTVLTVIMVLVSGGVMSSRPRLLMTAAIGLVIVIATSLVKWRRSTALWFLAAWIIFGAWQSAYIIVITQPAF